MQKYSIPKSANKKKINVHFYDYKNIWFDNPNRTANSIQRKTKEHVCNSSGSVTRPKFLTIPSDSDRAWVGSGSDALPGQDTSVPGSRYEDIAMSTTAQVKVDFDK